MRKLWSVVNNMKMGSSDKNNLFVLTLFTICGILGALVWLAIGRVILPDITWLFCFAGYPAVFGFFGGGFYLYNHEF